MAEPRPNDERRVGIAERQARSRDKIEAARRVFTVSMTGEVPDVERARQLIPIETTEAVIVHLRGIESLLGELVGAVEDLVAATEGRA